MSRVINLDSAGKERTKLVKAIIVALRELAQQTVVNEESYDLVAYMVLTLESITKTIDPSVSAWEKRGYWVKADKFRLEWSWVDILAGKLKESLCMEDWNNIALVAAQIAQRLNQKKVPAGHRLGTPWVGAWSKIQK